MAKVVSFESPDKAGLLMGSDRPKTTRILLVDDHPLVRQALRDVLAKESDLEVVGEADNGQEAIDMTERYQPDVVIMDIGMPVMTGVEATNRIKAAQPNVAILILTVHADIETIFSILQAGASGYLLKSVFGPEVVHTVRAVMNGDMVLAPEISQEVVKYALLHASRPARPASTETITPREVQMLSLAAKGLSNKEIGAQLSISETTVKSYFVDVFQKLNVRSRTEAIFVSLKSGLLSLNDLG
jgi:NarL family two-component system response regulator LiaR